MKPRPDHTPADPAQQTDAQAIAEAARVLGNSGGEAYGAGYSARLAERLRGVKMPLASCGDMA